MQYDGGPEFLDRFKEWYTRAGIKVDPSSAYRALSNVRAEGTIKHVKRLLEKTSAGEEGFRMALAEYCNAPRADGHCINDLFYNRQIKACNLPKLQQEIYIVKNQENRKNRK